MRPSFSTCFLPSPFILVAFLTWQCLLRATLAAHYHEQLVLKPLPLSALLASFNFRSNTSLAAFEAQNYRFFPRSLGQILQHVGTKELHLRFTSGRWDAESWGVRPWNGTREGGVGVELWAWLEADSSEEADEKWLVLTNALSGLFCASLNFIDGTRTTRPAMSFQPEGDLPDEAKTSTYLLHGSLPREVVCTENLTPFLKMLPCKGKAGIASLLDGHKLFDASWQTMAIDVRQICIEGEKCILQIEQTIDVILDVERSKRPRDDPIPRPVPLHELKCDTTKPYHGDGKCFPAEDDAHEHWSLSEVFGRRMKGSCPLSDPDSPPVCLNVPQSRAVAISEGMTESRKADGISSCYYFPLEIPVEIMLSRVNKEGSKTAHQENATSLPPRQAPLLYAERSLTGYGQERGGMQTMLTNPSPDDAVELVVMESLPWFMRVYLHTLSARIGGQPGKQNSLISQVYYRPAVDRARGTQLEVRMRIPPATTVFLTYDFEKTILRYTEYPPDANRGFNVAAAIITIFRRPSSESGDGGTPNLRTTALLLSLPTPDFSMPYNVIIFTSTAIALAFGGMFNILVRRFVGADEAPRFNIKFLREKLLRGLKASM